jgi:hypothetical protein
MILSIRHGQVALGSIVLFMKTAHSRQSPKIRRDGTFEVSFRAIKRKLP